MMMMMMMMMGGPGDKSKLRLSGTHFKLKRDINISVSHITLQCCRCSIN